MIENDTITTEQFSLVKYLQNDPDYAQAFKKRKEEVAQDKVNLLKQANKYNKKYEKEIEEGDKLRQKMLTEGKKMGLTETEIFKGNTSFMPTVRTPILNFLYFMLRDEEQYKTQSIQEVIEDYLKTLGYDTDNNEEVKTYIEGIIQNFEAEKELDERGDDIEFEDTVSEETTKEVEDLGEFLYGGLTTKEFKTVKKLKSLSRSNNAEEAFLAYTKCLELCKKYNLEFDRVPCEIK